MHHSCLCDSAKNISSKPLSQVVGKNVLGQSICRVFLIFDMLKTIWKPMYFMISNTYFQSMLFRNRINSIDFLCKVIGWTLYEYDIVFIFFKELFSEYFSLSSLVVLMLSWCFNEVTRSKMCIGWLNVPSYWHSWYWDWR